MGSGSSTITTLNNSYNITGNNNGIKGGEQSMGTATSSATTDVKPSTDLNYSNSVNPSWIGNMVTAYSGGATRINGTIGTNTDLIQTLKHVGATALRVGMSDVDFKTKTRNFVNGILKNIDANGVIKSTQQVNFDTVKSISDIHVDAVNKMSDAHDAYGTVAIGQTGMRNNEVSTRPTIESLNALSLRATPSERANEREILDVAGPRLGVVPSNAVTPPSDLIISTLDNAKTRYGRMIQVKSEAEHITAKMSTINFSKLHANATILAQSGGLRPASWESSKFIGSIIQKTLPFKAAAYPNGHHMINTDYNGITADDRIADATIKDILRGGNLPDNRLILSAYTYDLPYDDPTRDVIITLSGQLTISGQKYASGADISVGLLYRDQESNICFMRAAMINTELSGTTKPSSAFKDESRILNVLEDPRIHVFKSDVSKRDVRVSRMRSMSSFSYDSESEINEMLDLGITDGDIFSFTSQWQVSVNISRALQKEMIISTDSSGEIVSTPFRVTLVGRIAGTHSDPGVFGMAVSVQTPIINTTVVKQPIAMRYIGSRYFGTVIDLLGQIPSWYSTDDPHDPWRIYYDCVSPLINYAGKIAHVHVNSGAAYNLTAEHVVDARAISGLPALGSEDLKDHIVALITDVARMMNDDSLIKFYILPQRRRIFMRVVEVVMFQTLSHIDVYTTNLSELASSYLIDCNDQNSIEKVMDERRVKVLSIR